MWARSVTAAPLWQPGPLHTQSAYAPGLQRHDQAAVPQVRREDGADGSSVGFCSRPPSWDHFDPHMLFGVASGPHPAAVAAITATRLLAAAAAAAAALLLRKYTLQPPPCPFRTTSALLSSTVATSKQQAAPNCGTQQRQQQQWSTTHRPRQRGYALLSGRRHGGFGEEGAGQQRVEQG